MKTIIFHHISAIIMRGMMIAVIAAMTTSCADDFDYSTSPSDKTIRFNVSVSDGWNSGTDMTRSASETLKNQLKVTALNNGPMPLYLVPTVKDGISTIPVSHATRGTLMDNDNIASFGVFASIVGSGSGPDYMCNEEVTANNDWMPTKEYLWPGKGELHINAYSPYISTPGDEGITALPASTDTGELELAYTVPAKAEDQVDLMWSNPCNASKSPCNLTFNHALTAVRFSTGNEMTPCTVTDVTITGLKYKGTLNLETGEWSVDSDASATYSLQPAAVLSAAEGSKYVAPGTPVTSGEQTLILMPQELDENVMLTITIEVDGKQYTLSTTLDGQIWQGGKTITYRISANPNQESLILDIDGSFTTKYTGGKDSYSVKSFYINESDSVPVKWIAEFVDDNGNVIEQPNWIISFSTSGSGLSHELATTQMQDIVFDQMSAQTRILQNAADINATSGFTPYNLASATGAATVENTANSYIINAPGKYSLPLVYGNAIANSATNTLAYTSTSHNRYALKAFINHRGAAISDPYIYNNADCTPADAVLVWEDELNLVRNVRLSDDGHAIEFDIPQNTIRQGNALIAVRDSDGRIMWSWQLWVTDYVNGSDTSVITAGGKSISLSPRSIGEVIGGDVTTFTECNVKVRFTQTDAPQGMEPLQKTVTFTQTGTTISTPDYYTYYQWGRKDPMMSNVKQWYDTDHNEITSISLLSSSVIPTDETLVQWWTLNPGVFMQCDHSYRFSYLNLWNSNLSSTTVCKTVYDPSPVGCMVTSDEVLRDALSSATVTWTSADSETQRAGFYVTFGNGSPIFFAALGYRSGSSGSATDQTNLGEYWGHEALTSRTDAHALVLSHSNNTPTIAVLQEPRGHGFGVRPMLEP